jgi:hypothetical protein
MERPDNLWIKVHLLDLRKTPTATITTRSITPNHDNFKAGG